MAQGDGAGGSTWQANEDDYLFLQPVIGKYKLTLDVRGYRTDRGVCLDLADVIQSLDLPIRLDKKSRRATGWMFAEDQTFTLDRDAGTVQNMNTGRAPIAGDIYDTPEGWCVDTDALSRWFGIAFKPDLYNALIRLETDRDLPFMQAIERRSRAARLERRSKQTFDLSKFPSADMEYKPWRTPSLDVVAQGEVTSGEAGRESVGGRVELYAAGEALGASYFARFATDTQMNPQTLRLRAYRNDPTGGLLGPLEATQVAVGDVETIAGRLTGQTQVGRGAFVSNRPIGRNNRFSATTLRGTLPAGWDAELYRNGQLIAFQDDRGDGRYEFVEIELFYGRNDLEVVLYGPQGQVRREKTSVPVGFNQIEPGQTYYWAGVLQTQRDLVQLNRQNVFLPQKWRWGVGVERGLDQRTSVAFGMQSLFFDGARRTYAEGALMRTLGAMQLELAAAHEFGAGAVAEANALGRIGSINFGVNGLVSFGNFTSEFAESDVDWRAGFTFDTSLSLGKVSLPIQGDVQHAQLSDGAQLNEATLTTSVTAGRVAISAQLSHRDRTAGVIAPARTDTRLRLLANTRLGRFRLRGNAVWALQGPRTGLERANVRVDANLDDRSDMQGQVEYVGQADEFRFTAAYTRRFDKLLLRGDAFVTTRGGVGAGVQVAFSLGPDPVSGGVRVSQAKLARSGQADVTVFRDDDGNGRRDPGEAALKDVLVEAGQRSTDAWTGENGRTIVDELRPFRPVLVGVDESTLGDPFLAPAVKGIVITPRPGVMAEIAIPISPSGEVEGLLLGVNGI
ncbi:MAG: carboxypeptidase regulatory-like domain-containing protein, partial [Erythrobacter sp.]